MPKKKETLRTEVHLVSELYEILKTLAEKEHRSIKNYTEIIVINYLEEAQNNISKN